MRYNDFINGSYSFPDISEGCQSTVNLYVGVNEAEKRSFIKQTPGFKKYLDMPDVVRGMYVDSKNDLYVVAGKEIIRVREEFDIQEGKIITKTYVIGGLQTSKGKVGMAENGFQLCVVDGENLYIYIYEDDTFRQYRPEGWKGSNIVSYNKGFFIFVEPNTQKYYISALYDGKNIDALDFASAEDDPDPIVAHISSGGLLYMFGSNTVEIMNNTGDATFPYSPASGGSLSVGCIAKNSVETINNQIIWLGKDRVGFGTIYMTTSGSLSAQRISNFAVESFLQQQDNISDATAMVYQENGHNFYCLNFQDAKTTFCYDLNTGLWHERRHLNKDGTETRNIAEISVLFNNKHIVSHYNKNAIYHQSLDYLDEDGEYVRRTRRSPQMKADDMMRMFFKSFKLDVTVNKKLTENPKIYLRYSNDNGFSYTDYIEKDLKTVVEWNLLGSSINGRVWEISYTDKVSLTLNGVFIK